MSLSRLERRHYCPLSFDFHGQELEVIDHKGQPWFTAETIGRALGYADPAKSIHKIYERNKAEFGPDEVTYIEKEIEVNSKESHRQIDGGILDENAESRSQADYGIIGKQRAHTRKQKVIIFSLRGAYHFGFFAKTELGRQYRQWVLDLIEARHQEASYYAAFRDVVGVLSDKYPLWQTVHRKFSVGEPLTHIARDLNIPVSRVSRAIRQMRHYKVLTEKEYQVYRADGRTFLKAINKFIKQGGVR